MRMSCSARSLSMDLQRFNGQRGLAYLTNKFMTKEIKMKFGLVLQSVDAQRHTARRIAWCLIIRVAAPSGGATYTRIYSRRVHQHGFLDLDAWWLIEIDPCHAICDPITMADILGGHARSGHTKVSVALGKNCPSSQDCRHLFEGKCLYLSLWITRKVTLAHCTRNPSELCEVGLI